MKHRSKARLTKQVATKRDIQRARDDILSAIVHSLPAEPIAIGDEACEECGYLKRRVQQVVNG